MAVDEQTPIKVKGFAEPVRCYKVLGLYDDLAEEGSVIREESDGFKVLLDLQEQDRAAAVAALEAIVARLKASGGGAGLNALQEPDPAIEREQGQEDRPRPQHVAEEARHLDRVFVANRPHHEIGCVADIGQGAHEHGP